MKRHKQLALVVLGMTLLAGCGMVGGQPTATPLLSSTEGVTISAPALPPSWTPRASLMPPGTPTPRATLTPTLTTTAYPSPTLAPGWREYAVSEGGYALRLPPSWLALPLEGQTPLAVVAQVGQDNPALAASLRHGVPPETLDRASFLAFDSAATARDATFVSTLIVGRAATGDYQGEADQRRAALEADPNTSLEAEWPTSVGFESKRGWLLRYSSVYPPAAPSIVTYHTQVYVENGRGEVILFTFSTELALREGYERVFEWVLDGVHFSP